MSITWNWTLAVRSQERTISSTCGQVANAAETPVGKIISKAGNVFFAWDLGQYALSQDPFTFLPLTSIVDAHFAKADEFQLKMAIYQGYSTTAKYLTDNANHYKDYFIVDVDWMTWTRAMEGDITNKSSLENSLELGKEMWKNYAILFKREGFSYTVVAGFGK